jgi:hypothetical protein
MKLAMDAEGAVANGTLHPFKCPAIGQDGMPISARAATILPTSGFWDEPLRQGRRSSPEKGG